MNAPVFAPGSKAAELILWVGTGEKLVVELLWGKTRRALPEEPRRPRTRRRHIPPLWEAQQLDLF